jgi:hypothetical protein
LFAEETLLNLHLIVGDDVRAGLFVSACHWRNGRGGTGTRAIDITLLGFSNSARSKTLLRLLVIYNALCHCSIINIWYVVCIKRCVCCHVSRFSHTALYFILCDET